MNCSHRPRLAALLLAQMTLASAFAQTTWDAGGADTNIGTKENWNNDTLPVMDGTASVSFGSAGSVATVDNAAYFNAITLNRTSAFDIQPGAGVLSLRPNTTSSSSVGAIVASSTAGAMTVSAPLVLNTVGGTRTILNVINNSAAATGLAFTGGMSASSGTYSFRLGGSGKTVVSGALSGINTIQQSTTTNLTGSVVFDAPLAMTGPVQIAAISSGTVGANAVVQMGTSTSQAQSWTTMTINQGATIRVNSTATMSGGVSLATTASGGSTGGTLQVGGNLTATTLTVGGATYAGILKVSGSATFTGAVATGAATGSKIVGDGESAGTLTLASGTIGASATIGGTGTNENNLNLVKNTSGVLTLNGTHTYGGTTTVNAGTLAIGGTIASPVTINAGGTISGEGAIAAALTFAPGSSSISFDPATQTDALRAATLSATGATVVVSPSGALVDGTPYTVLKLTGGTFTGNVGDTFALGSRGGSLSYTAGNTELTLTGGASGPATLVWTGASATNPTFWDSAVTVNWTNNGAPDRFFGGDNVIFDDSAAASTVALQGSVSVGSLTFNNGAKSYALTGGTIGGAGAVTHSGSGSTTITSILANGGGVTVGDGQLTLGGVNTFTGGLDVAGGTLSFTAIANLGSTAVPVDITDGGVLQFAGASTITNDALGFTFGTGGGAFDIATATNVTIRVGGKVSGSGDIIKSGAGVLALGRSSDADPGNDFTGALTVSGGTLDIRAFNSLGATSAGTTVQNATLLIQNFGQTAGTKTFAAEPLTFTGNAFVTSYGQENKLYVNQLSGPVTVSPGAVLGLSAARNASNVLSPWLELTGSGVTTGAGSTLSFGLRPASYPAGLNEDYQTVTVTGPITGPAAVVAQGTALSLYTLAAPGYAGDTTVLGGTLKLDAANTANDASTVTIAASGAKLELNFAGTDTVNRLFVGTTQLAAGVYKAVGNTGATGTEIEQLTGSGTLTVTSSPAPVSLFASWAAGFGLTGDAALAASDPDGDGLSNILEYATGTSPIVSGPANITLGQSSGVLSLTYTRVADPALTYTVEGTGDLTGTWSTILTTGNPSTGSANVAGPVTILDTVPSAPKRFLRLRVAY